MTVEVLAGVILTFGGVMAVLWKPLNMLLSFKKQFDDTLRVVGDLTSQIVALSAQVTDLKRIINELQDLPERLDEHAKKITTLESSNGLLLKVMYVKEFLPEGNPQREAVKADLEKAVFRA